MSWQSNSFKQCCFPQRIFRLYASFLLLLLLLPLFFLPLLFRITPFPLPATTSITTTTTTTTTPFSSSSSSDLIPAFPLDGSEAVDEGASVAASFFAPLHDAGSDGLPVFCPADGRHKVDEDRRHIEGERNPGNAQFRCGVVLRKGVVVVVPSLAGGQ